MLKELFTQLFEELKKEKNNDSTKLSGCFKFFVVHILEEKYGKPNYINYRTLVNYYKIYVKDLDNNAGEPKRELKDLIANYLGYKNYSDFEVVHKKDKNSKFIVDKDEPEKGNNKISKNGKIFIAVEVVLILAIGVGVIYKSLKKECFIWKNNQYISSSCRTKNAIHKNDFNIDFENFKKVKVDVNTPFFENGEPSFWYGKSATGEIEFFTSRGKHPETQSELKPVTEYIINKYVFINTKDKTILE